MVALVSNHDDVHVEALGTMAFDNPKSIKRNTIFRIVSLTSIRLDDSIEPWLPELANRRVLKSISTNLDNTVSALRAITLRDLLTYRMGFGSIMGMPNTYPIQYSFVNIELAAMVRCCQPNRREWMNGYESLVHCH